MEIVIENIENLKVWCKCNPRKQPRPECPYHNSNICLCCNQKAEYCGKHNHLIEWNHRQDCTGCTPAQCMERRKVTRDFAGGCPIEDCDYRGGHSHYYCCKHRNYFDNQDLCNDCQTEEIPSYDEVVKTPPIITLQVSPEEEVLNQKIKRLEDQNQQFKVMISDIQESTGHWRKQYQTLTDKLAEANVNTEFWQDQ